MYGLRPLLQLILVSLPDEPWTPVQLCPKGDGKEPGRSPTQQRKGLGERERTPPRSGSQPPDPGNAYQFEPCVYVSTMDVLPGTHVDPEQGFIGLLYAEQTVGFDSVGATSDKCCIALDEKNQSANSYATGDRHS